MCSCMEGQGALEITPHSSVKAGWMVWGGISIGGRTDLHIIRNGTLTGRRYLLRPHVIPYAGFGDSRMIMPDRARLVENMLEAETIQRMEFPVLS
ncbi:hypothetical protein TNCV_783681 [Trichonephila clavipes]|nr:hypothetical protein TNCV_783681 [Trichonephila clavipes]